MVDDRVSTEFPTNRGERAHHPRMKSEDESNGWGQVEVILPFRIRHASQGDMTFVPRETEREKRMISNVSLIVYVSQDKKEHQSSSRIRPRETGEHRGRYDPSALSFRTPHLHRLVTQRRIPRQIDRRTDRRTTKLPTDTNHTKNSPRKPRSLDFTPS